MTCIFCPGQQLMLCDCSRHKINIKLAHALLKSLLSGCCTIQVLAAHWKDSAGAKRHQAFTEDPSHVLESRPLSANLALPVWVDMPLFGSAIVSPEGQRAASPMAEVMQDIPAEDLMDWDEDQQSQDSLEREPAYELTGIDTLSAAICT